VAKAIAALPSSGIRVSVVTDNMIAALIETVPIREVWTQYVDNDGECATAINGAHMAALLARAYEIPCLMFPISDLSTGRTGLFAGEDIRVQGASTIAWEPDIVPLDLVTEVIEP
jgi:methylthioribose-1-phosphate isomerase